MNSTTDLTNGYGEPALRRAFEAVQNPENWKYEIDAWVEDNQVEITVEAIIFFTGSLAEGIEFANGKTRLVASGYYAAVGA